MVLAGFVPGVLHKIPPETGQDIILEWDTAAVQAALHCRRGQPHNKTMPFSILRGGFQFQVFKPATGFLPFLAPGAISERSHTRRPRR